MTAHTTAAPEFQSSYGGLGPAIVGVCWSLFCLATILVGSRIYTHLTLVKSKGGWALFWACVAYPLGVATNILCTIAAAYGIGSHIKVVAMAPNISTAFLLQWVCAQPMSLSAGFAKVSAVAYILDVQGRTHTFGRWVLYIAVGINFILYIVSVPFMLLQCDPSEKLWNPSLPGECAGIDRGFYTAIVTAAWGAATDLLIALYPVFIVYKLQIRLRLKLILCFLMALGVLTAVCSIMKMAEFHRFRATSNPSYEIAPLMIWGVMEMWVVLIASSVPPVWPLVRRLRLTAFVGLKHNGLRWGQQDTANSDFGKPPAGKGDTPRHLKLHRLVNRSASQEAIVPPGGIGMKRDFVVTHDALPPSDANGDPDLGSTHFENAYGRPPWENDRV